MIHSGPRAPLRITIRIDMTAITGSATRGCNVRTGREICRTQHRSAVLVSSSMAGRTAIRKRSVIGMVFGPRPCRRRDIIHGGCQCRGMASIARSGERDMAMPCPQRGIGRGDTAVMTGRTLAGIRCGMAV